MEVQGCELLASLLKVALKIGKQPAGLPRQWAGACMLGATVCIVRVFCCRMC